MSNKFTIDTFTISNYRSFCDDQTIEFKDNMPVMAFYGANASGKTNIYSALLIFKLFVLQSTNPDSHGVPYDPFLLRSGMNKEKSKFTLVFHNDSERYSYSFSMEEGKIAEEEMYDLSSSRPRKIFVRSEEASLAAAKNGFGKKMFIGNEAVRDDSLLITLARRTKNKYADAVYMVVNSIDAITLADPNSLRGMAVDLLQKNPNLFGRVLELLKRADFTIEDFSYGSTKITPEMLVGVPFNEMIIQQLVMNGKNVFVNTMHSARDGIGDKIGTVVFDMARQESLGTNAFFNLIVPILDAIDNGRIVYIDEFGGSLHTYICQFIVQLFKKIGLRTGAKLLINTHDVGLIKNGVVGVLDKRDIMIVEKDRFEQTRIVPLTDKMKRTDDNVGKKYMMGIYGGVPILEEADGNE